MTELFYCKLSETIERVDMRDEDLKIIGFERNGNVVRFYLGAADLQTWYGDDWNDAPYEHNAGTVYSRFVKKTLDVAFPFDWLVLEPSSGVCNSSVCKDDMRERHVPMLVITEDEDGWINRESFKKYSADEKALTIYMGDSLQTLKGGSVSRTV